MLSFYKCTDFICRFFLPFQEFSGNSTIGFHHFVFRRESTKLAFGTIRIGTFVCRITTGNTFIGCTIGTTSFCSHFGLFVTIYIYLILLYAYGVGSFVIFTGDIGGCSVGGNVGDGIGDGVGGTGSVSVLPNRFRVDAQFADIL